MARSLTPELCGLPARLAAAVIASILLAGCSGGSSSNGFDSVENRPQVWIEADLQHAATTGEVSFQGHTTLANIIEWQWDFGDGTQSNEQSPSHVYASHSENYPVSLCITTSDYLVRCSQLTYVSVFSRLQEILTRLNNPDADPMVIAHRACHDHAPENSIAAIQACIDSSVDIIELDVRITQDHQLVVMHDKTLERTTTFDPSWPFYNPSDADTNKVSHHTLAELKTLLLTDSEGNPTHETIPTLAEAMLAAKGQALIMIDKWESHEGHPFDNTPVGEDPYQLLQIIARDLTETGTLDQAVFMGFHDYATIEQLFSAIPFYGNLFHNTNTQSNILYVPALHRSIPLPEFAGESLEDYFSNWLLAYTHNPRVNRAALSAWFSTESDPVLDPVANFLPRIKAGQLRIWVNVSEPHQCAGHDDSVLDRDAGWGWVLDRGASMLLTGKPHEMLDYYAQRASRTAVIHMATASNDVLLNSEFQLNGENKTNTPATAWHWRFGDGNTSSEQNPTHRYQIPGDFEVVLTMTAGNQQYRATRHIEVR